MAAGDARRAAHLWGKVAPQWLCRSFVAVFLPNVAPCNTRSSAVRCIAHMRNVWRRLVPIVSCCQGLVCVLHHMTSAAHSSEEAVQAFLCSSLFITLVTPCHLVQ